MPFVLETHGDAVIVERPQGLAQHVVQLPFPLAPQELHDRIVTRNEKVAVTPEGVPGIRGGDPFGVTGVPGVLRALNRLSGCIPVKGWQRWSNRHESSWL